MAEQRLTGERLWRFADHQKSGCRIGTGDFVSLVSFCREELATQGVDRVLRAERTSLKRSSL